MVSMSKAAAASARWFASLSLLWLAGGAHAAAPAEWASTSWGGSTCTSCHGNPAWISTDGRAFSYMIPSSKPVWNNLGDPASTDVSAFKTYMQGAGIKVLSTAMTSLADTASDAQFRQLRNYFLELRDGVVTSSLPSAGTRTPGGGSTTMNLGTVTFNGSANSTATITITNPRFTSVTYQTPSFTGNPDFSVSGETCSTRVVSGNDGSCTITVRFLPNGTAGARSATMTLAFADDGIGLTPRSRSFVLNGFTNLAPLASAGGNQTVPKNATVTLSGSGSSDGNGDTLTYSWTVTAPGGGGVALGGSGATRTFTASQVGAYGVSLTVNDGIVNSTASAATITVTNTAPVAVSNYTAAATNAPTTVTLSSAGSNDPNGDAIGYLWAITSQPAGSVAALSSTSAASPTFGAVKSGTYRVTLAVSDGTASTNATPLDIVLGNTAPTASAGSPQSVTAPVGVNLSGSGSDANGDTLSYAWAFTSRPTGSGATLVNATTATPSFSADKAGSYVVQLTVSDGNGGSATSSVTVTAANTAPTANAGADRTVTLLAPVTLAGSGSDPNGDTLAYSWTLARPGTSAAALSGATTATPSFTPDVEGAYTATLTVSDGQGGSASDSVVITGLLAPTANAGPAQLVTTGSPVTLDGSGSRTSTSGALSYAWSFVSQPAGSTATLAGAATVSPSFVADVTGNYLVGLQVTDSLATSPQVTVTVTADRPPVASAGSAQAVLTGTVVTLDGSASSDADGDTLTYAWTLATRPAGSAATLGGATTARPTFTPDVAGGYVASLVVNDGRMSSTAATVTVTATNPPAQFTISTTGLAPSAQLTLATTVSAIVGNSGGQPLTLATLTFGGAAAADYSLAAGNGCTAGLSIALGGSCTLALRFAPGALGSRVASLSITHDAAGSPATLALNGSGLPAPQGQIALGALSLTFPATQVGTTSPTQSVTVQNTGDALLAFSGFDLAGTAAADYTRGGSCSTTAPLAVGATCTLTVSFAPTAAGSRSATLTLRSDASNGNAVIALGGTATPAPAPAVGFDPAALAFGTQTVGGVYPARSVTLSNSGTADLTSIAVSVTGTGFATTGTPCPDTLAAGASCTLQLVFAPATAEQDYTGSLRVASNASGSPHVVALSGRGTAAVVPSLAWTPAVSRLDFGNVTAGSVSPTQSATLVNNGPGGATITLLNAVGPESAAFSVTAGTCVLGQVLFEGQQCTLEVRFAPGAAGAKTATVQVAGSANAPAALVLAGTGLGGPSPSLALSTSTLAFNGVRVGTRSLPAPLTLRGSGSGVVTVLAWSVGAGFSVQSVNCPPPPFALPAGAECSVTVTFEPQAEGAAGGTLTISTDGTPAQLDAALSGSGEPTVDDSSGGCSIARGDRPADPTLWLLLAGALAALAYRRRGRR